MSPFDLIIAEKESQANDIADALGVPEKRFEITTSLFINSKGKKVVNSAYLSLEGKIKTKLKNINGKKDQIQKMEADYNAKGKAFTHLKGYKGKLEQLDKWTKEYKQMEKDLKVMEKDLIIHSLKYWENTDFVILYAEGHLISTKFVSEKESGESIPLKFSTEFDIPSRAIASKIKKWVKLHLIEHFLEHNDLGRIICGTDYDREGATIFGTIMDINGIALDSTFRMKFSTLELDVLRKAYNNLISFEKNLYYAGLGRTWSDYVIGYNINPYLAEIYRETIIEYLRTFKLPESKIDKIKYKQTYNIGRVKAVILEYLFDYTQEHIEKASKVKNKKVHKDERVVTNYSYNDDSGEKFLLFTNEDDMAESFVNVIDISQPIMLEILDENQEDEYQILGDKEIPTLMDYTAVLKACSDLGAGVDEIDRILENLYLQKYISYPRSQSQKWEIPNPADKELYAHSVLKALGSIGYPIKPYYYKSSGNEGSVNHSHPCIHPLPSLTLERVERLKEINPMAFMVLNEIAINTLKAFERLPKLRIQTIEYKMSQGTEELTFYTESYIDILKPNILTYTGFFNYSNELDLERDVVKGSEHEVVLEEETIKEFKIWSNRSKYGQKDDFDVITYLNEKKIGTEATRSKLLKDLVGKQYIYSQKVLYTTFLGNLLIKIAKEFTPFIDINLTVNLDENLRDIEEGKASLEDYKERIKKLMIQTSETIVDRMDDLKEIILDSPLCPDHDVEMVIEKGIFGKFFQCPYYYVGACDQKVSIL